MDTSSSSRQDKRDSKKKHTAHSVYTAKHVRISAAITEKNNNKSNPPKSNQPKKN